ncbi:MAG: thiamine pyrophosphate-dependent enzyme [Halanaerobiales bacterium]
MSLTDINVFGIPIIYIIGWRGEPGILDEPQHLKQGEVTPSLLSTLGIAYEEINQNITLDELVTKWKYLSTHLSNNESVALLIKEKSLEYDCNIQIKKETNLKREDVLKDILSCSQGDLLVSTTGKTSREIFEIRDKNQETHNQDFLTVGSMGHASSIALGVSLQTNKRVWAIDGDGAMLMHMGAMTMIGTKAGDNFIHVVINNGAHESVGGQPSVATKVDLLKIASGCGYKTTFKVETKEELREKLKKVKT